MYKKWRWSVFEVSKRSQISCNFLVTLARPRDVERKEGGGSKEWTDPCRIQDLIGFGK
jgi:hypothetical protein